MQKASYSKTRDPTTEPLEEPDGPDGSEDRLSRATHGKHSIAEETATSAVPPIVLNGSESLEGPWDTAAQSSHGLGRSDSSKYSSSRESLNLDDLAIGDPLDDVEIPKSVECFFNITFDGAEEPVAANSFAIHYTAPNSYQKVEKIAQGIAQHHAKVPNFNYGNCTVIGEHAEKYGLALTTREDWDNVCAILKNYWRSDPLQTIHIDIYRDYVSYRSRATSDVSLAATKRRELHNLIKFTSAKEGYIPRTALMRFNSSQNIREIIIQDDRLDMTPEEKEIFIQSVQTNAQCLLALCVYAGLKMECLRKFLERGFGDAALPTQTMDCCHENCAPSFGTLLNNRGCFTPARFDNIGEHQDLDHDVVIPLHFVPVDEGQDDIMRAGRRRDVEKASGSSTRVIDDVAKKDACCGSGAYSNVYRVKIHPDHHRLLKDKMVHFALKEFRDRDRSEHDFQRERKLLDELRRYSPPQMVTHLATWTHRGRYYMLFPLAQCNLRQYMRWIPFGTPTKKHIIWLIRQFRGLAEALKGIHDLSSAGTLQSAPDLATRPRGERKGGYHHDLKPENILFYKATGNFEISDFGSGKVQTYRSGSYNTSSPQGGTPSYEPPEAAGTGGTSRPYDMWSLGCVFLELLVWAVLGFQHVEEFRNQREDRRYPGSPTNSQCDDAFWQMLQNGDVILRTPVENYIKNLKEAILQQRKQPFKEILDLVVKMLDTVKETRIPALDLFDTLDRIFKQKKIDLENFDDGSLPNSNDAQERSPHMVRLSMVPPDRRSLERTREEATITARNSSNVTGESLLPPGLVHPSPRISHSRNSSASEFVGRSRNASIASSNMSTHGRHGSTDEQRN